MPEPSRPRRRRARSASASTRIRSQFSLEVRFLGGLTQRQQDAFQEAADRWSEIIIGDLPDVEIVSTGELIDDVLIEASGTSIDGPKGILGQASPTHVRPESLGGLPAKGLMQFDTSDLARMENDGSLKDVIIHEMGHVLGIGTLWRDFGLLRFPGSANPVFVGESAQREFGELMNGDAQPVPVANVGEAGTRDSHWREAVFGNELMTGIIDRGSNPISRMTIASVEDMGYEVNYEAADRFPLPSSLQLAMIGVGAREHNQGCCASGTRSRGPEIIVLPE